MLKYSIYINKKKIYLNLDLFFLFIYPYIDNFLINFIYISKLFTYYNCMIYIGYIFYYLIFYYYLIYLIFISKKKYSQNSSILLHFNLYQ